MAPNSLSTDKRLEAKRVVRRMAKNVRRSIRSTSRIDERQEMWRNLEKHQPDEVSRTAASQLLLLRLELKEMLRAARNNNFPVDELMSRTGLGEECVRTILEKYGYGDEKQADPENSEKEESRKSTSPEPSHGHDRAANVRFDMPRLDMTGVRKGGKSPEKENSDGTLSGEEFDDVVVAADTPPANRTSVTNITAVSGKSPREVTDSSAEISDLAKRLGSRLYQDASLIDQLKNFSREKTFVDQLKDIVATSATLSTVQLKFIPSVPLAKPIQPPIAVCKEIDVQTSICIAELPAIPKEMRDNATDLPSLDYLGSSELGGLQQIPQSFTVHEDVSSSAFSSDQSAGQVPAAIIGTRTTIPFTYDGSVHLTPSRTVQVSELSSLSAIEEGPSVRKELPGPSNRSGARTPRVSESPWRPSSRRLHLEEVNISTSQEDSNSLEVISVGTPKKQPANLPLRLDFGPSTNGESLNGESGTPLSLELSKDSLDSSHHDDEEHTYNQLEALAALPRHIRRGARGRKNEWLLWNSELLTNSPVLKKLIVVLFYEMVSNARLFFLTEQTYLFVVGVVFKWSPSLYKNKRAAKGEAYEPTRFEHWANTISHGIGIVPSVLVFRHMVSISHRELQFYLMIVYGLFTTLLFSSSTCYHVCELKFRQKGTQTKLRYYLHICDRAAIYLFIAASYTPWLTLRHCGYPGLNLKWMIWVFALFGILYQYNFHEKYKTVELFLYILIAGGPSVAIFTMNDRTGLEWMIVGGLVYIIGVIFFKLDGIVPFAHAIWHIFVLIGASCHTYAVYSTLLGPDPNNPVPDVKHLEL